MPRRVRFDFFQVELPDDERRTFAQILQGIGNTPNFQDRNVDTADGYTRLQSLNHTGAVFLGLMIRGRESNLPIRTTRDGDVGPLPIGPQDGIGEETSFLFSARLPVLVLQVNRDGTRPGAFATYFTQLSEVPVSLLPIIDPDVMARLGRMTLIRSLEYRVGQGPGLAAQRRRNVAVGTALDLMDRSGAVKVEVTLGRGRGRGYLDTQWVKGTIRAIRRVVGGEIQPEVERLLVGGRENEATPYEVLDLIRHRIVLAADVQEEERRISSADCWRVLQRVYEGQRTRLREMLGPEGQ